MARDDFEIAFVGLDEVDARLEEYERIISTQLFSLFLRGLTIIADQAAQNAPVDTGNIRNQIFPRVLMIGEDEFSIALGSWSDYAYYVHEGTDHSKWQGPPLIVPRAMAEGIAPWAERHGMGGAEYAIAASIIQRGGLEPNPYLLNAVEQKFDEFMEYIAKELESMLDVGE